jgi:hypothetical protein
MIISLPIPVCLLAYHCGPYAEELWKGFTDRRRRGKKEKFDPRTYLKLGEAALAERVKQAVVDLRGVGTTLFGGGR